MTYTNKAFELMIYTRDIDNIPSIYTTIPDSNNQISPYSHSYLTEAYEKQNNKEDIFVIVKSTHHRHHGSIGRLVQWDIHQGRWGECLIKFDDRKNPIKAKICDLQYLPEYSGVTQYQYQYGEPKEEIIPKPVIDMLNQEVEKGDTVIFVGKWRSSKYSNYSYHLAIGEVTRTSKKGRCWVKIMRLTKDYPNEDEMIISNNDNMILYKKAGEETTIGNNLMDLALVKKLGNY